ncbi:unnamed protein product [Sphagnum jensenii]
MTGRGGTVARLGTMCRPSFHAVNHPRGTEGGRLVTGPEILRVARARPWLRAGSAAPCLANGSHQPSAWDCQDLPVKGQERLKRDVHLHQRHFKKSLERVKNIAT